MSLIQRGVNACYDQYGNASSISIPNITFDISFPDSNNWKLISDREIDLVNLIVNIIACSIVAIFGLIVNSINLIVFTKQGFADAINVSFASLAIADLMALLTLLWRCVLYTVQVGRFPLPVDPIPFVSLTAGWPHVYFIKTGSWITAFITFHRCLSIAMPLKVKSLVTPRKVVFIHLAIYGLVSVTIAPLYYTNRFAWVFSAEKNRSLIGVVFSDDRYEIESVVLPITVHTLTIAALLINVVCISILVVKLKLHSKWRHDQKSTGNMKQERNMSVKETRIVKMTVAIGTIYMICFLPHLLTFYWKTVDPEVHLGGEQKNFFILVISLASWVEGLNSCVNIFVYYKMSSKFKSTLHEMMRVEGCRRVKTERR